MNTLSSESATVADDASPRFPDLKGQTVFITGGGSGIGAEFTRAFTRQGANVGFVSLRQEVAGQLCDDIERSTGKRPFYVRCDIRDIAALKDAINETRGVLGPISILVNNAARDTRHALDSMTVDEWDNLLNTNLRPYFFTAQAVQSDMAELGHGSIINLGSNSANLGLAGYPAYVASKAAIVGMTKALARELGQGNIRVNALISGWVLTERQKELWATEEALSECLQQQCLKTFVTEENIANTALFLASGASSMISGQSIIVDGGRV